MNPTQKRDSIHCQRDQRQFLKGMACLLMFGMCLNGYGLSYTTFEYSRLTVIPTTPALGQDIEVQADITNTGRRAGEEIAQLYLSTGTLVPDMTMPVNNTERARLAIPNGKLIGTY